MSKLNWQRHVQTWMARNQRVFKAEMSALSADTLELSIMDVIGESFFGGGITAEGVKAELDKHPDAKAISVLINSPGGIISEGTAIHSLLARRKAGGVDISVEVLGEAASMASVIAMVGTTITMHKGSIMMVHEGSGMAFGNADDFRASADMLDTMTSGMLDIYEARTGMDRGELERLAKAETFMTAEQAIELGFADTIAGAEVGEQTQGEAAAQRMFSFAAVAQSSGRQQGKDMTDFSKVALALGLTADTGPDRCSEAIAGLNARATVLDSIESATGKKGEEALGVITAWKGSHEELGPLKVDLAAQKATAEKAELDSLIEGARSGSAYDDKAPRITAAQATTIREQVEAKEMSVKAVKAQLAAAHPVAHLSTKVPKDGGAPQATSDEPWRGKTYGELTPTQCARLKRENPELRNAMKADAELKG